MNHASDGQTQRLDQLAGQHETIVLARPTDPQQDDIELAFHSLLLQMTANPIIARMRHVLEEFFRTAPKVLIHWNHQCDTQEHQLATLEHYTIVKAIEYRDAETLRATLHCHLKNILQIDKESADGANDDIEYLPAYRNDRCTDTPQ